MTQPESTYQLSLLMKGTNPEITKVAIKNRLHEEQITAYVEGCHDNLDIFPDEEAYQQGKMHDALDEMNEIWIYSYDKNHLETLASRLKDSFKEQIDYTLTSIKTTTWTEGWKDSFKPIATRKFLVHPPWDAPEDLSGKKRIIIDPGMAFGTGQHATTQLCLEQLEDLFETVEAPSQQRVLDMGTGSGILALAAATYRCQDLLGVDIDHDSILACHDNMKQNHISFKTQKGTTKDLLTDKKTYTLIIANILAPVLKEMMPDFRELLAPRGYLLLSGILIDQKEALVSQGANYGFSLMKTTQQEDWCSLLMQIS